jgi:hypothetical protein
MFVVFSFEKPVFAFPEFRAVASTESRSCRSAMSCVGQPTLRRGAQPIVFHADSSQFYEVTSRSPSIDMTVYNWDRATSVQQMQQRS